MIQTVIVIVLVAGSVLHAGWILMPRSVRQIIARRVLALSLPLPGLLVSALQNAAVDRGGCACHGCEHASQASTGPNARKQVVKAQPVVFHHRH